MKTRRWDLIIGVVLGLASGSVVDAGNWPSWRGPDADGIASAESELPVRWDQEEDIRWRVPLPQPGNSTPIVWGDRTFVTQAVGKFQRTLMCFRRSDGMLLWQSGVEVDHPERTHRSNPYASASPVTDGERVICWFGSAGVVAYDFEGDELWRADLGRHDHQFGYGGSPVIHGNRVFLNFGPGRREFVVALDKESGEELWRHRSETPGKDDIYGMWSTPFVVDGEGEPVLITALRNELAGLDPATGDRKWYVNHVGIQAKSSPVVGEGVVVLSGDLESAEVAVELGGEGNVGSSHLLWRRAPPKSRVSTGIIHNGHIYNVQTSGIADCIELRTGNVVWEERLRGKSGPNAVWSSPMMADEKIYVMNQSGDVFVYRAETDFELLAVNSLRETTNSSVVPSDGSLVLRTHEALRLIGPRQASN